MMVHQHNCNSRRTIEWETAVHNARKQKKKQISISTGAVKATFETRNKYQHVFNSVVYCNWIAAQYKYLNIYLNQQLCQFYKSYSKRITKAKRPLF